MLQDPRVLFGHDFDENKQIHALFHPCRKFSYRNIPMERISVDYALIEGNVYMYVLYSKRRSIFYGYEINSMFVSDTISAIIILSGRLKDLETTKM